MNPDTATPRPKARRGPPPPVRPTRPNQPPSPRQDPYRAIVDRLTSGNFAGVDVLKERGDGRTCRAKSAELGSVIVKLWSRPKWRHVLRRLSGTTPAQLEWAATDRLHRAGLPVPKPMAAFRIVRSSAVFTDAHLLEDLGELVTVQDRVKALIDSGRESALGELEDQIIDLTCSMVCHGVLDTDHSLLNLMLTPTDRLVRIDFELARCVKRPGRHPALLGGMVGRLVVSYAFTLQPHVERAERLAAHLVSRLGLSPDAIAHMRTTVESALERQLRTRGISTTVQLPTGA